MRSFLSMIAATLLIGGAAQARSSDPEAELARALEGRVAGTPVHCIDLHRVQSSQIINRTAILYRAAGVIYVNRPDNGADALHRNYTMVNRLSSTQLCNVDTVTMIEPGSGTFTGVVFLGEFVPYRRAASASAD